MCLQISFIKALSLRVNADTVSPVFWGRGGGVPGKGLRGSSGFWLRGLILILTSPLLSMNVNLCVHQWVLFRLNKQHTFRQTHATRNLKIVPRNVPGIMRNSKIWASGVFVCVRVYVCVCVCVRVYPSNVPENMRYSKMWERCLIVLQTGTFLLQSGKNATISALDWSP